MFPSLANSVPLINALFAEKVFADILPNKFKEPLELINNPELIILMSSIAISPSSDVPSK
jgi:hypothetical protein